MKLALLIIYCFVLGSIPFGLIIARLKGIDIRGVGSGNIGATNVLRAVGKFPALLTLLGDMLKGVAAVSIGRVLDVGMLYEGILGISAIAGHNFSLFLKFRGGKGVATSLGVALIYMPLAGILTLIIWLLTSAITRYSSLGAIVSFVFLPLNASIFGYSKEQTTISIIITAMIVLKHRENIKLLIKGTERKISL